MISSVRKTSYIVLTRPQKPFRVLSVDSTSKSLQFKFAKIPGTDDYGVEVETGRKDEFLATMRR